MDFAFDKAIRKDVLENYLSRSVTAAGLYASDTLEDDLRAVKELGVKFLGRASGIWYMTEDDEEHFSRSKALAERVHAIDPDIILQACVFEIVVERMEEIPIPEWVFQAFGQKPEKRNFSLKKAMFEERPEGFVHQDENPAKNGGIPDLNRLEAQMWFYYRATRYIDCGYEALHMGQVHLYTANDKGMEKTMKLFEKIRDYAREHARRHKVLLDAHTHGVSIRGKLMFDYHAMPFTRYPLIKREGYDLALVREGYSEGGENPNGWSAEVMPYLMEYDNWGGKFVEDPQQVPREELAAMDWWGYDQIGWFANQPEEFRNHFLEYTYRWVEINNPNAYFQVPFRRMLSDAALKMVRMDNQQEDVQAFYQCNNQSQACPMGFSQEEMIKKIWSKGHGLRQKAANPQDLLDYGGREIFDKETGYKLPQKVVVYGSFQPEVGAVRNDSNSEVTRMYYVGDGRYMLSVIIPYAGTYDFAISTCGTLSATYSFDRFPRSGSSNKGHFQTEKDNAVVKFTFVFMEGKVSVEVFDD